MRFFKTGPGQYGEGDRFLGVTVPQTRSVAQRFKDTPFPVVAKLLRSGIHEERLCAILLLVHNFERSDEWGKKRIVDFYLRNSRRVNNWDLVDLSADKILGAYLLDKPTAILAQLARSSNIWERRIAIVATFRFIKASQFDVSLKIARLLFHDEHDLIHKALGWMLREIGKRSLKIEETFLCKYYREMPRTMLRYAIERFPEKRRKAYLSGRV